MRVQTVRSADDIAGIFYKDVVRYEPLTHDEQLALFKRYKKHDDQQAKEKLILSNLRFVIQEARKFEASSTANLLDLIDDGILGLIRAVERFNVRKNVHFITYAVWWIRQAIMESMSRTYSFIRLPNNILYRLRNDRFMEEYKNDERRKVKYSLIRNNLINPVRRYIKARDGSESEDLLSILPASAKTTPEYVVQTGLVSEGINRMLASLNEREKKVLSMRFGLGGYSRMSLKKIAESFRLTKERVRQIQKQGLHKLKGIRSIEDYRVLLSGN